MANDFLKSFIPNKDDDKRVFMTKIVFIICAAIIVLSIILIPIIIVATFNSSKEVISTETTLPETAEGSISVAETIPEETEPEINHEELILPEYKEWYKKNNDMIGWIKVPHTPIDYPVLKTDIVNDKYDNFYIDHGFNKEKNINGAIFTEWRYPAVFSPTERPNNTILYGHNIRTGEYFAKVTNYYPAKFGNLSFYLQNPTVEFNTLYEKGTYKVFACIYTNTMKKHGEVFEYHKKTRFEDSKEFYDYIANIMDRSTFYTDVDIEYGDELLTLSTCYYQLGESVDTRVVVFARRVREGEDVTVDTSKAYINPDPLYFDAYYNSTGRKWGGRAWDTTKVKGFDEYLTGQN